MNENIIVPKTAWHSASIASKTVGEIVNTLIVNGYDVAVTQTNDEVEIAYESAKKNDAFPTVLNDEESDLIDWYRVALGARQESEDEEPLINILYDVIEGYRFNCLRCQFGEEEIGLQHLDIIDDELPLIEADMLDEKSIALLNQKETEIIQLLRGLKTSGVTLSEADIAKVLGEFVRTLEQDAEGNECDKQQ